MSVVAIASLLSRSYHFSPAIALIFLIEMGNRYLKSEIEVLKEKYPSASEAEIMSALPGRSWTAVCKYARSTLGLHRTQRAIGLAVSEGLAKAKRKREKEEKIKKELFKKT